MKNKCKVQQLPCCVLQHHHQLQLFTPLSKQTIIAISQLDWDDKSKLANVKNGKLKCLKFWKTQFEIDLTEA